MNPGYLYLKERNIAEETIKTFKIGYYGNDSKYYCRENVPELLPLLTDKFLNGVIFPIYDLYSSFTAIVVRKLDESNGTNKYDATRYIKSNLLYGLYITYKDILDKKTAFIVEGIFDFLSLWQANVKNVVSILGSDLSFNQLCLLLRFANKVVTVMDGDFSGRRSAEKISKLLTKYGVSVVSVPLPEGYDPDTYLNEFGINSFKRLVKDYAKDIFVF